MSVKKTILTIAVLAFALESVGYWFLNDQKKYHPQSFYVSPANLAATLNQEEVASFLECTSWICYHPTLGWWQKPDSEGGVGFGKITTDHRGSRVIPASAPPPVRISVATYGDSFTQGIQVDNADTYQAKLFARTGADIQNYGVLSYGPDQALLYLEQNLLRGDRPDIVIMGLLTENMNRLMSTFRPYYTYPTLDTTLGLKPILVKHENTWQFEFTTPEIPLTPDKLPALIEQAARNDSFAQLHSTRITFPYSLSALQYLRTFGPDFDCRWPGQTAEAIDKFKYLMRRFVDRSIEYGFAPVIFLMPIDENELFSGKISVLHNVLDTISEKLVIIDPAVELRRNQWTAGSIPPQYLPYTSGFQPTPEGNDLFADVIRAKLCDNWSIWKSQKGHDDFCAALMNYENGTPPMP